MIQVSMYTMAMQGWYLEAMAMGKARNVQENQVQRVVKVRKVQRQEVSRRRRNGRSQETKIYMKRALSSHLAPGSI